MSRPWLATTVLALAACGHERPASARGGAAPPPREVATAAVERTAVTGTVAVPAAVQARQRASLAARIPASIVELPWREGDRVPAGAVVARLEDAALRSALLAAEAVATAADADKARVETLLTRAAATPKEAEEARARAAATAAAVAAARDNLNYAVLRAPFEATVTSRPVNVGDVVQPGATVVEIEGRGGLEARATVEAELVGELHPGLSIDAIVDGQPGPLKASVTAVSASADPATHRFEVRADLPPAAGLRSGLFARLLVPSSRAGGRLLVPRSAVFQRGGLEGVFVVQGGTALLRWIAAGQARGTAMEVRAGVEAGERVALDPKGLADGQPVADKTPGAR